MEIIAVRTYVRVASLAAAGVLCVNVALAQQVTGAVSGRVTGENGAGLDAATVSANSRSTGLKHSTQALPDGRYMLAGLPVDDYDIEVARDGFGSVVREHVSVEANDSLIVDFMLKAAITQTVEVIGTEPLRGRAPSAAQQTISEPLVHDLPLLGRHYLHVASLAPGFTGNPNFPSPQGQLYWSNNVLVDGASNFSSWRSAARAFYSGYPLESIKEVHILANQYSAEFGEALATVTSAVTRSGTNAWKGSALLFIQNGSWDGVPPLSATKPPGNGQQFGFTLGGPLMVDRTHVFGTYEGRRSRRHNVVVSPAASGTFVPNNEDEHLAFFKIDAQVVDRQLATVRYNGQRFRWHDETGGLSLPGTGTEYANDVQTILGTDSLQLSPRLLNDVRVQFARYVDRRRDLAPGVLLSRAGYALAGGALGPLGFGADPEDTWEGANTLTYWRGDHVIKAGGGMKYIRATNTFLDYGWGAYFFAGDPLQFPQPFLFAQGIAPTEAAATAHPRSLSSFAFVQDEWRLAPRLTLDFGLRYDVQRVSNVHGFTADVDGNNLQPRLGVAWTPTATDALVARGGIGLYTQQHLLYYINRVQLEGQNGTQTVFLPATSPLAPGYPATWPPFTSRPILPPRDVYTVDPSFRNPYSIQATAGVERRIGRTLVAADFLVLDGRDLMSLIDANAPASIQKPSQRSVAEADATRPLPPEINTFRKILTLGNEGRSWYRALQVQVDRTTDRIRAVMSYTLSRAEDMANYQLPEDSRNVAAEKAPATNDVRHNASLGFTWEVPGSGPVRGGWSLSGVGTLRSARPYTITWGDDRNGTTQNDARPGVRNGARTDAYQNLDVGLTKRVQHGRATIEGRLEAFNLFNTTNYDEYVGALSSPLYSRPISAFPPRRLQAAVVVRF